MAEGTDFAPFQNVNCHHKESNQMHGMFVQVVVVLLAVALSELVIVPDNVVHLIPDIFVIAQRIV